MVCLREDVIIAVANGDIPAHERDAIERHLDGCPTCLALVVDAAQMAAAAIDTEIGAPPSIRSPWRLVTTDRYEIGDEIARGGMGQIFAAHDRRLGRTVAIKCARDDNPAFAARFSREVELTARLQHPSIIAIHDSGQLSDGRAFYAMPRIHGQPLDRRIAAAERLDERLGLLPHIIALVDAMAYVHDQGILHRDLKPQNVLVGEFGETVLVDWGLAKVLGAPDDSEDTAQGLVVGTRGYMAPEQASGGEVDRRADVYGLGATLMHLITGRAPSVFAPAAPPPHAPVDLLAIAARATAAAPTERYASARELAEDLHRFQTGRLVQAHRYSAGQLIRRWVAQHRAVVSLAAAAVVVVAVVSAAAIRGIVVQRHRAEVERVRAEDQRDAAQGLVGFSLGELRDELDQAGRLDALASVANRVGAYYQRVSTWETRPIDLRQRAAALGLLGEVRRIRADVAGAIEMHREAVVLARQAMQRDPSADADQELCRALLRLGESGRDIGLPDAAAALTECEGIARRRLAGSASDSAGFQLLLARVLVGLGNDAKWRGEIALARRRFEEAQALGQQLEDAGDARGAREVVRGSAALGQMLMERGDWGAAAAPVETLLAAAQREVTKRPYDMRAKVSLQLGWLRIGMIRARLRQRTAAEEAFQSGHRIASALSALEPDNMLWYRNLGVFEQSLGYAARDRGDLAAACAHFLEGRRINTRLLERDPAQRDLRSNLAASELDLGDCWLALRKLGDARQAYDRALTLWQRIHDEAPSAEGDRSIAIIQLHLGRLELAAGRRDAARQIIDLAATRARKVLSDGDDPEARRCLVESYAELIAISPERRQQLVADAAEAMLPLRPLAASDPELSDVLTEVDRKLAAQQPARR